LLLASCTSGTIGQLKDVKVDLKEEKVGGDLDKAMQKYLPLLDKSGSDASPESILLLADLKAKADYDFTPQLPDNAEGNKKNSPKPAKNPRAGVNTPQSAGTMEAIGLYQKLLKDYPNYKRNDHALYQLARIHEEQGNVEEAMNMMNRLVSGYPRSGYIEEVQFRRGEYFYTRKKYSDAQDAYRSIVGFGVKSPYYEFALNKLGWTYYKQERYEEGLRQFVTLLDHKVSRGYDLDRSKATFDDKGVEDTYNVMSLSFSYLGGADAVTDFFGKYGKRTYEASVYRRLAEYFLEKRRYSDASATFNSFVKNNPKHKEAPYFDMWAIDSYLKGGFHKLVIEAKRKFIIDYGLKSAYWTQSDIAGFAEVSGFIKSSTKDLASLYHVQYQDKLLAKNKEENFREAIKWYREFLKSFPKDKDAPDIHYRLAELLLENHSYDQAAIEFENIAYGYSGYNRLAEAEYAGIYALRKSFEIAAQDNKESVRREIIRRSLKFAETFSKDKNAAIVLGAALDDLYFLKEYKVAAEAAKKLISRYSSDRAVRRSAWLVFAHSSFETGNLKGAEEGYLSAISLTEKNDPSLADMHENLAATLYKLAELASQQGDLKLAARYFLLVGTETPAAKIRPVADFDGIAALIRAKDFDAAKAELRSYKLRYSGQPQLLDLSKKIALAYRESGELLLAAEEYERIADETQDMVFKRASFELAADLYYQARKMDKAYGVYKRYVALFPKPLEYALEMHTKIAAYLKTRSDMGAYVRELRLIMDADINGGAERTDRTRYLGADAALDIAEFSIRPYTQIKLENPYEENLRKKQQAMMEAKDQLENLFEYETDVVSSAATFYLAEMYYDFSKALMTSERPYGLKDQEKEQYELAIEEQAFPFEEKSIQVHQKNLELMSRGIYNVWIEKSIEKLAKILPARYAKYEESCGYVKEIGTVGCAALVDVILPATGQPPVSANVPSPVVSKAVGQLSNSLRESTESDFLEAMRSLKLAQYPKAIKLLNQVIAQSPNNPVSYVNLALIYDKMQSLTLAEENLKQANKLDPENPVVNNEYALLYRKTARFSEARKLYEKILDKYKDFILARKNLGILCDVYMKDYKCALNHYEIYSSQMPGDGTVKNWIADLKLR